MVQLSDELLDSIHSARACLVDISELAGKLSPLSAKEIEPLLLEFVEAGEDMAVSRLLHACACNERRAALDISHQMDEPSLDLWIHKKFSSVGNTARIPLLEENYL